MIQTRQAKSEDAAFLENTFLAALREPITIARGGSWDEMRERRQFRERLPLHDTQIVLRGAIDVGFFTLVRTDTALQLNTLCVLPSFQSQGVGSDILGRILRTGNEVSLDIVTWVLKSNPRALACYQRLDFVIIGDSEHHYHLRHVRNPVAA